MKTTFKMLLAGAFAFLFAALASTTALAADPYDGVNRIGTYYQQSREIQYSYGYGGGNFYDYAYPPRAGGWFGSGTEYLTGLREPVWSSVPPVHYTHFYQPVCGWPCYTGGYGYPRASASQFPYRSRLGGIYGY